MSRCGIKYCHITLLLLLTLLGTSINKNKTNNNNITLEEYKGSDVLVVTTEKSPTKFIHYCEAQGKGRARVDSGSRLLIVNCRLSIINIDFPEALH